MRDNPSDCRIAPFGGSNTNSVNDLLDKYFTVARFARSRILKDGLNEGVFQFIGRYNFELGFDWQSNQVALSGEPSGGFGRVAHAPNVGDVKAGDAEQSDSGFHLLKLMGSDHACNPDH